MTTLFPILDDPTDINEASAPPEVEPDRWLPVAERELHTLQFKVLLKDGAILDVCHTLARSDQSDDLETDA